MLQCPRCSNPLTVTHHDHDTHDSALSIIQYPVHYQNCVSHSPQQRLQDARDQERNMLVELQSLQIKVLENQLQQVRLGHELMQAQLLPARDSAEADQLPRLRPEVDTETILLNSILQLEQCGWYYGRMSWQQSELLLRDTRPGTFMVRDSQDPRFLYSVSLQRSKEDGPTSVRVAFARGKFSLDADDRIRHLMPSFDSIGSLISHYVEVESMQGNCPGKLFLKTPLYKAPPSLAHCARLQINKSLQQSQKFSIESSIKPMTIPPKLLEFINRYSLSI